MRIFANVKTSINRYKDYRTMTKDDLADFYQSKCDYYQEYVWVCLVVGTILSVFYIVPDYLLNGSIIPTLIPRLTVLGILLLFLVSLHFFHSRTAILTADYFLVHSIIVATIFTTYALGIKTLASEFFLIMNLIFLIVGFVARLREIIFSYIVFLIEILISHFIIHYENLPVIIILTIPCGLAVIFSHMILTFIYLDHYRLSQKLELAMITDPLTQVYNRHLLEKIVSMNVSDKVSVITEDTLDNGLRQTLNYGHTVGHVIERNSNFSLAHGVCVAKGMGIMIDSCEAAGTLPSEEASKMRDLIKAYGLPVSDDITAKEAFDGVLNDKKKRGDNISVILVNKIGHAEIKKMTAEEFESFIGKGKAL